VVDDLDMDKLRTVAQGARGNRPLWGGGGDLGREAGVLKQVSPGNKLIRGEKAFMGGGGRPLAGRLSSETRFVMYTIKLVVKSRHLGEATKPEGSAGHVSTLHIITWH